MAGLGPVELALLVVVPLVLGLWALYDALPRPLEEWAAAGQNRTLWLTLLVLSLPGSCLTIGAVLPILYVAIPRPALNRARADGRSTG